MTPTLLENEKWCKGCNDLACNMAFMLGKTHDAWTNDERETLWALIRKWDKPFQRPPAVACDHPFASLVFQAKGILCCICTELIKPSSLSKTPPPPKETAQDANAGSLMGRLKDAKLPLPGIAKQMTDDEIKNSKIWLGPKETCNCLCHLPQGWQASCPSCRNSHKPAPEFNAEVNAVIQQIVLVWADADKAQLRSRLETLLRLDRKSREGAV